MSEKLKKMTEEKNVNVLKIKCLLICSAFVMLTLSFNCSNKLNVHAIVMEFFEKEMGM